MRIRWHKWWLVALTSSACTLNPQPDLPLRGIQTGGAGGTTNVINGAGGTGASGTGDSGGVTTGSGGASAQIPSDAGPESQAGASEAGAGGEAGLAGAPPTIGQAGAR
jgi:hypothetical protein